MSLQSESTRASEQLTSQPFNYDLEIVRSLNRRGPDYFLQRLVEMANEHGLGFGVTLYVGGALVSGDIIGGRLYFERLQEELPKAFEALQSKPLTEEQRQTVSGLWQPYADIFPVPSLLHDEQQDDEQGSKETPPPTYIHLQNVKT